MGDEFPELIRPTGNVFRDATTIMMSRLRWAAEMGLTFLGKRDIYRVLGYKKYLTPEDFRRRYERDGVATRIIEAYPAAIWRGGPELIEDEDPDITTPFEELWEEHFVRRLKIWSCFERAHVLSRLGEFGVLLVGMPGELHQPRPNRVKIENVAYVQPYAQTSVSVERLVTDAKNPRYGYPEFYNINRADTTNSDRQVRVHHSRVIHFSDAFLDDNVYGEPALRRVWNYLDDLTKVSGGGSEAFWQRANKGTHFNLDKDFKFVDPPGSAPGTSRKKMAEETENYVHGISRMLRTQGMTVTDLGSDVADFKNPQDAILMLISAATGIPKRILEGSERGELASTQDKSSWDQRVNDKRLSFAGPYIIDPFVEMMIESGALPEADYTIRWPQAQDLDDIERANLAIKWASLNRSAGTTIVTAGEIRDRVLRLPPLEEVADYDPESDGDPEDEQDPSQQDENKNKKDDKKDKKEQVDDIKKKPKAAARVKGKKKSRHLFTTPLTSTSRPYED